MIDPVMEASTSSSRPARMAEMVMINSAVAQSRVEQRAHLRSVSLQGLPWISYQRSQRDDADAAM
jgi:hypothetical protein